MTSLRLSLFVPVLFAVAGEARALCTYSLSPDHQDITYAAATGSFNVVTGAGCSWSATSNATWITVTNQFFPPGPGAVSFTVAENPGPSGRTGTITAAGRTFTITQGEPPTCNYITMSPDTDPLPIFPSNGGSIQVLVTMPMGCSWSVQGAPYWVVVRNGSGQGNGSFWLDVFGNLTANGRSADLFLLGSRIHVMQLGTVPFDAGDSCALHISTQTQEVPREGGRLYFAVQTSADPVPTAAECVWTLGSTRFNWLTLAGQTSPRIGSTRFPIDIAPNGGAGRLGVFRVSSGTNTYDIIVRQGGVCQVSASSISASLFTSSGGPGAIAVAGPPGCSWTAVKTYDSGEAWDWITVTDGSAGSGDGIIHYSVEPLTWYATRQGGIFAGSNKVDISQDSSCVFHWYPLDGGAHFPAEGGTGSAEIIISTGCLWRVAASDWITITSAASGSGSSTVTFTVPPNSGPARSGNITITDPAQYVQKQFPVTQDAPGPPPPCAQSLDPSQITLPAAAGGMGSFQVNARTTSCQWTATKVAPWITLGNASGTGSGTVQFTVAGNTGLTRTDVIRVDDKTFTLTQQGTPVSITVTTNPVGLTIVVDGQYDRSPKTFSWLSGTSHTIFSASNQGTGVDYIWESWSDSGAQAHEITVPATPTTYTATFRATYQLVTNVSPAGVGTITASPSPPNPNNHYNAGQSVRLTAIANPGHTFAGWSGGATGNANPIDVVMNAHTNVTATFTENNPVTTISTNPAGLQISAEGANYTSPKTFTWPTAASRVIGVPSPQQGAAGTRYTFSDWNDGGTQTHSITVGLYDATYTANFTTQYLLTTSVPAGGGTIGVTPSSADGYYNLGMVVELTATASPGYTFAGWSGGGLSGNNSPQPLTMTQPRTVTATFTPQASVTINTNPARLQVTVNGAAYEAPKTVNCAPNTNLDVSVAAQQSGAAGTRHVFANWSDGGARSHSIPCPATATTYTANFTTQYFLMTTASPAGGGMIAASPSSNDGYYNANQTVQLTATASQGYAFTAWTGGGLSGNHSPQTLDMTQPRTVTATFTPPAPVTIITDPAGLQATVNGVTYAAPKVVDCSSGTNLTIGIALPPQSGGAGTRYVFANWSDGGVQSHTIPCPATATTYIANFTTQYLLTTSVSPAGKGTITATPSAGDGYYNSGQSVQLNASPSSGYDFSGWSGAVSGNLNPKWLDMTMPRTVTATFNPSTTGVTVTTSPLNLDITVDGQTNESPWSFAWPPGSTHTIATPSPQPGGAGARFVFANWSDGGTQSHSITVPAASTTTYTATFITQNLLTTNVSPAGGGSVTASPTSADGYYNATQTVQLSATPSPGYTFTGWSGAATGTTNPQPVPMNAPKTVTATFTQIQPGITITTNPGQRQITVDGQNYTAPRTFTWLAGSSHTIGVESTQAGAAGTRYVYSSWSDSGAQTHTITVPSSDTICTAAFVVQHQLTASATGGTITANPASGDGYYNAGQNVQLTAGANQGYGFTGWSGGLSGNANPQTVTMNAPTTVTATFTAIQPGITIASSPAGRQITVDGQNYAAPQTFTWPPGSSHTIGVGSPQAGSSGTRYAYSSWSDSGAQTHAITVPGSNATYSVNFTTQHQLTMNVSPAGAGSLSASPPSADGYYGAGQSVQINAESSAGYAFAGFSGALSGTARPQSLTMSEPRIVNASFIASTCTYTLNPTSANLAAGGGPGSVTVTTQPACQWTALANANWITIGPGGSGVGSSSFSFSVDANPGAARTGTISAGGQTVTIQQAGTGPSTAGLRFVPLEPCRLMETRAPYNFQGRTGAFGPPHMGAGESRTLTLSQSNVCQVPSAAKAYVLNVTLVPRGPLDYVTVWPGGESRPEFWTIRSPDGQIVANSAIVKAGAGGSIGVYASNDTEIIIDISGYFTDNAQLSNLVFYPLTPCRVLDTRMLYRPAPGAFGPPSLAERVARRFQFPATSYCSIPQGARAYSVTLTAVPQGPLQFVTAWPAGSSQPNVSSINSPAGRILANSVILPASQDGSIDVLAFNQTDFLIDINGYFAPDDGQNGLFYYPVTQCRLSNTQDGSYNGAWGGPMYESETSRNLPIPSCARCNGIPAAARAYALNVTAMPYGPMPFITVWPLGQGQPNASILNAFEGQIVTNSAIIPAGSGGGVNLYAYRRTHVAVEISGYFGR